MIGIGGVDGFGGDYLVIVLLLFIGVDVVVLYLIWDDLMFVCGVGMFFEIVGCYCCYYCLLLCIVYFGKLFVYFIEGECVVVEGIEVGFVVVKLGNVCEDIVNVFFVVLCCVGIEKDSCCGYLIGVSYLFDWGECMMSLCLGDWMVFEFGMMFYFMLGLWFDDWGLEIMESILIIEIGVEMFCNVLCKLFVKE